MEYSNAELLKQFAIDMNGKFIDRSYFHAAKAAIKYQDWQIIFDNYTEYKVSGNYTLEQIYARVTVRIKSNDNFRFELYRQSLLSSISKIFGAQDIKIGDPDFDKSFILKTNDELKLKAFLLNPSLRNQIAFQDKINLQISDKKGIWENKLPAGELELSYFVEEPINDYQKLKSIYILFTELLYQLKTIGAI